MYYAVLAFGLFTSMFNKKLFQYLLILILCLLAFLRYGIGTDYFAYQYLFDRLQPSVSSEYQYGIDNTEVGFRLIGAFMKGIGLEYQAYLIVFAAVNLIFVYKTCVRFSKNPTLALTMYFAFYYLIWTFSGIRQGVTIAVGVYYLLRAIKYGESKKFIVVTLFLSLIHVSALFLIPLYLVSKMKLNKQHLMMFFGFSFLFAFLPVGWVIQKLTWLPFFNKLYWYIGMETGTFNPLDFQSIGRLLFLFIAFFFYNSYVKEGQFERRMMNVYIVGLSTYFMFQFSELTASRLSIYAQYLNIIIFTNLLFLYKKSVSRLIYLYCLGVFSLVFLFKNATAMEKNFVVEEGDVITPYIHIYNKDEFQFTNDYFIRD